MPVSAANSRLVYDALKACGIRLLSALPETWLVHLIRMAEDDPEMTLVRLAKEEEGVGISAGAHLAGVKSAMLMQNHGFLASVNGIVSLRAALPHSAADADQLPRRLRRARSVADRGRRRHRGRAATRCASPTSCSTRRSRWRARIRQAQTLAEASLRPVALLLCRDLMWED